MKKIMCCLFLYLLCLTGCYLYCKEVNNNGIGEIKVKKAIKEKYQSYSADGILVKNVDLSWLNDTISKRCFTSTELEQIKKIFLKDSILAKRPFVILAYRTLDIERCIGLFTIDFPNKGKYQREYTRISLLKLKDTILINKKNIEQDFQMENYIRENLSTYFDTIEIQNRIDIFFKGERKKVIVQGRPTRLIAK
jgi:hypothetical protein